MKKRVADWIAEELAELGAQHCFMVTGGGAMHLNDAFGLGKMRVWCLHHEQSCAIAAEACARVSGTPAVVNVTTGPGGINALNGVFGAWTDSIPMVVVSGQVKRETMAARSAMPIRQLGDQEGPAADFAACCCKGVGVLEDPRQARAWVRRAWALSLSGRPGPVWLDVPVDVQGSLVDEADLAEAASSEGWREHASTAGEASEGDGSELKLDEVLAALSKAKRPLVMMGSGARLSGIGSRVLDWCEAKGIGAVGGWGSYDLAPQDRAVHCGRPGTVGDRAGNFAVQNCDFLLILGCRVNIRQASYAWGNFAKGAFVVQVDADWAELEKPTARGDLRIHANLKDFWPALEAAHVDSDPMWGKYARWCRQWLALKPSADSKSAERIEDGEGLNPYEAVEALSERLGADGCVVVGNGTVSVAGMQSGRMLEGQRWIANSGCASMGYDLPASFGAWVGLGGEREVLCLAGDGSAMMNIHDLHSWAQHGAKIRAVVFDNGGYHSIRQTQKAYFKDSPVGYDATNGIGFPNLAKVAEAFGCAAADLDAQDAKLAAEQAFAMPLPAVGVMKIDPGVPFAPKLASRKLPDGSMASPSLEDMHPFLPKETMAEAMPDWAELSARWEAELGRG